MQSAAAAGKLSVTIEQVELPGGEARNIRIDVQPDAAIGKITIARAVVDGNELTDIKLDCEAMLLDDDAAGCRGRLNFDSEMTGPMETAVTWRYDFAQELLAFNGSADHFGGSVDYDGRLQGDALGVDFAVSNLAIAQVLNGLEGISLYGGHVSGKGRIEQVGNGPLEVSGSVETGGLGFDNVDGTIAAADLAVTGSGTVALSDGATDFDIELAPGTGEVLVNSLYLNFSEASPNIALRGRLDEAALAIESGRIEDKDAMAIALSGSLPLADEGIGAWRVGLERVELPATYDRYLGNFTEALGLGRLASEGSLSGELEVSDAGLALARLDISELSVSDSRGRFSITALDGAVNYGSAGETPPSTLRWADAGVYQVPLGGAEASFIVGGDRFELLNPLRITVFDGALAVDTLAFTEPGESEMTLDLEAEIEPISLRPVTEALDWPLLNGTLSGTIPRVTLRGGVVEVGGAVRLSVFDGSIVAANLRLERLFGVLPTLAADVTLTNLDLQQMTGAFSFGEIEGRLGGSVKGLRLLDWQPVAFDLDLRTPPDDRSRHRISQRAVDNLSSIGGGPTGVLSSGFLSIFDDFGYDKVGLSCRLQNNVCTMGGVAPGPNGGYYIVKGAGIPRIDVIGYSREVDFPQLVNRLQAATATGAPTIN